MKALLAAAGAALALLSPPAAAQPTPTTPPPARRFFLDYGYHEAREGERELGFEATRYQLTPSTQVDSIFGLANHRLRRVLRRTVLPVGDTLLAATHWRADGHLARHEERLAGKWHGTQRLYGPEGGLRRQSTYERGQEQSSTCYDAQGAVVACPKTYYFEQMPEFPGGMNGLMQYLARNVRYPGEALRVRAMGKVQVAFLIDETGQPRDVHVKQGVMPALDAEALRVMRQMPRWQPGRQQDEPVPVYYTVPVTFSIR